MAALRLPAPHFLRASTGTIGDVRPFFPSRKGISRRKHTWSFNMKISPLRAPVWRPPAEMTGFRKNLLERTSGVTEVRR